MSRYKFLLVIIFSMLLGNSVVVLGADYNTEKGSYKKAFELIRAKEYEQARVELQLHISNYPNGVLTASSYYWLGEIFLFQKKYTKAIESFKQVNIQSSTNPKVPSALYKLGIIYNRLGQEKKAQKYFQKVIALYPDSDAYELAQKLVIPLTDSGEDSVVSKNNTNITVAQGDFDKGLMAAQAGDFETALAEWTPLAEQGDADAQYNLGVMYDNGYGVPESDKTAAQLYTKAAQSGDPRAQLNLGNLYVRGHGVKQSYKEAAIWYTRAAEQGFAPAQDKLGTMYSNGEGLLENDKMAVKWYIKAAMQGYANAQFHLGVKYRNGEGVPKNDKTAVKWYTKAAEQGHASAQYNLGQIYRLGEVVLQSDSAAFDWYTKAAEQGNALAQTNLGVAYANGLGVLTDYVRAYMWYNLASYNGNKLGVENKTSISEHMTSSQIAKAQEMSSRCLESGYTDC